MVDMAHIAGLVATGAHPSPFPHADVVTSTTHKTLRGPRGGLILTNDGELARAIDKAVFPGTQGGPLMHVIAGKAVAFGEALQPEFHAYIDHVVENAAALGEGLAARITTCALWTLRRPALPARMLSACSTAWDLRSTRTPFRVSRARPS